MKHRSIHATEEKAELKTGGAASAALSASTTEHESLLATSICCRSPARGIGGHSRRHATVKLRSGARALAQATDTAEHTVQYFAA